MSELDRTPSQRPPLPFMAFREVVVGAGVAGLAVYVGGLASLGLIVLVSVPVALMCLTLEDRDLRLGRRAPSAWTVGWLNALCVGIGVLLWHVAGPSLDAVLVPLAVVSLAPGFVHAARSLGGTQGSNEGQPASDTVDTRDAVATAGDRSVAPRAGAARPRSLRSPVFAGLLIGLGAAAQGQHPWLERAVLIAAWTAVAAVVKLKLEERDQRAGRESSRSTTAWTFAVPAAAGVLFWRFASFTPWDAVSAGVAVALLGMALCELARGFTGAERRASA